MIIELLIKNLMRRLGSSYSRVVQRTECASFLMRRRLQGLIQGPWFLGVAD